MPFEFAGGNDVAGITVLGDMVRPDGSGRPGGADRPALWLFNAVKRQVARASGRPVGVVAASTCPALAAAIMAARGAADPFAHWAAVHDGAVECAAVETVLDRLGGRFCIGYELPPYVTQGLERRGIAHLDLRIHPVRFMDDLMFAVRASSPETQARLRSVAVSEGTVLATVGLREAMCRLLSDAAIPAGTLLVVGQRPWDSSQIQAGRFFDAHDHRAAIHATCASHAAVLLKPHPLERDHSLLHVAAAAPARMLGATADNIYRLLSLPEITTVLTVNSSVAVEAALFGKQVVALAPPPVRVAWREDDDPGAHLALDDRVLGVDFWRMVLAPHMAVTPEDGALLSAKPNRLRIALDSFWEFQQIDTDRIPARAASG